MNKKEIFEKLDSLDLKKDEYIVISGASMVVQGIKTKTNDIDIAVTKNLFNQLKQKSILKETKFGYEVYIYQEIEFATSFYNPLEVTEINGYRFSNVNEILKLKKELNRKKDKLDIKKIETFLALKDNYVYERDLIEKSITLIAGVDEVGRGPLVGPVVAAAVILPINFKLKGLTDSKKLTEKKRNEFDSIIKKECLAYGIGEVDAKTIDEVNIYEATKIAMKQAINNLKIKPEHVLIDAMKLDINIPITSIIKGDLKSLSIAAASVIAKVYRDHLMYELDKKYPCYNFKQNKGYPTKEHQNAIKEHGILDCHRKSFSPVSENIGHINNEI